MTKNVYENEVITQTVETDNLLTGMSIGTLQADFLLCEADFLRLKVEGSAFVTWSLNVLFATIGYAMSILPKWISELAGKPEKVSQSEWTTFAIGLMISFILFVLSKAMPNEKKKLLNRISQHFKSAPKSRQLVRGQQ
jgi:hypothetical protein